MAPTLVRPPPPSTNKAPIEDVLELTPLRDIDANVFTNTRPIWHPPGARGIYGGSMIAQCLAAAQKTVPVDFYVHSMHCYFVLNGSSDIPVVFHVEHVREGRSFATRTVQARQRGKPIFTTTLSFCREGSGGKQTVEHARQMPDIKPPGEDEEPIDVRRGHKSPFVSFRIDTKNNDSPHAHAKNMRQWIKARGRISEEGGTQAHLSAVAYISDSYFIGTVARAHRLMRFNVLNRKDRHGNAFMTPELITQLKAMSYDQLKRMEGMDDDIIEQLRNIVVQDGKLIDLAADGPEIGMMVSLDHSIYFHNPQSFRADEWMLAESETPWAGDGRGLVMQRIFAKDGTLIASCIQEGVVRLKQPKEPKL